MDHLPPELLTLIGQEVVAKSLSLEHRYRDLWSLSLVSKSLTEIATPLLYEHFQAWSDSQRYYVPLKDATRTNRFVRTILKSPKRTAAVRNLRIGHWYTEGGITSGRGSQQIQPQILELIELSKIRPSADWSDIPFDWNIRSGLRFQDAELIILLSVLPNLRTLEFTSLPSGFEVCLKPTLESLVTRFKRLTRLTAIFSRKGPGFDPSLFLAVIELPHLEEVELSGTKISVENDWCLPRKRLSIEKIQLKECGMSTNMVNSIVTSCKSLNVFKIEYAMCCGNARERVPNLNETVSNLALHHKDSLKHLVINTRYNPQTILPEVKFLKQFPVLTTICINEPALLLEDHQFAWGYGRQVESRVGNIFEFLPDTLEHLTITTCTGATPSLLQKVRLPSDPQQDKSSFRVPELADYIPKVQRIKLVFTTLGKDYVFDYLQESLSKSQIAAMSPDSKFYQLWSLQKRYRDSKIHLALHLH